MNQKSLNQINRFNRINLVTVVAVYFLILVGGIVRSSGAGMGCPDWPKCFGNWIPPTSIAQLPTDYKEVYLEMRLEKNERFVSLLTKLGLTKKAEEIKNDESILIEEDFNSLKTWIEYINRLIGACIGVLIIFTLIRSLPLWKLDWVIPILSGLNLILVIFQGWIGSIVVSTNLLPWMISLHMLLALVIVCLLLFNYFRSKRLSVHIPISTNRPVELLIILCVGFVLMIGQVLLGTQVREGVDRVAFELGNTMRADWVENLGITFIIHRSYSLLLIGLHLLFIYKMYKFSVIRNEIFKWSQILIILIFVEIVTGIGMAYFGIPPFLQPIHLLIGSLIIGIQFFILLHLNNQKILLTENIGS